MILLIDNYDSFSYNLYQLLGSFGREVNVIRNDAITPDQVNPADVQAIVISPGPGRPADAGVSGALIEKFAGVIPILGVCLGHQAICEHFGATITYAPQLMHGKASEVAVDTSSVLFEGLAPRLTVARYHSLIAAPDTIPASLRVTAQTDTGEIMAVEHVDYPVFGVQFHPESILTPEGPRIIENFLKGVVR